MAQHQDLLRTVLITGCSSGIGRCVALGLKERGHRVFATVRNPDDVDALEAAKVEAHPLDLRDPASIDKALDWVLFRSGGSLDALFNNAAYAQPGALEDLPTEALRLQFETNLFGQHELTRRVIPLMRKQGFGRIIMNSSVLGFAALKYRGAYNASKFALEGYTDTLRMELADCGVHVSLIEPGPIVSRIAENSYPHYQKFIDPEASPHQSEYHILEKRLQTPEADRKTFFTLEPEAVLKRVVHALEHPKPKVRYHVTTPTYLLSFLKRVMTRRALDGVLRRIR